MRWIALITAVSVFTAASTTGCKSLNDTRHQSPDGERPDKQPEAMAPPKRILVYMTDVPSLGLAEGTMADQNADAVKNYDTLIVGVVAGALGIAVGVGAFALLHRLSSKRTQPLLRAAATDADASAIPRNWAAEIQDLRVQLAEANKATATETNIAMQSESRVRDLQRANATLGASKAELEGAIQDLRTQLRDHATVVHKMSTLLKEANVDIAVGEAMILTNNADDVLARFKSGGLEAETWKVAKGADGKDIAVVRLRKAAPELAQAGRMDALPVDTRFAVKGRKDTMNVMRSRTNDDVLKLNTEDGATVLSMNVMGAQKNFVYKGTDVERIAWVDTLSSGHAPGSGHKLMDAAQQFSIERKAQQLDLDSSYGSWPFYYHLGARPSARPRTHVNKIVSRDMTAWVAIEEGLLNENEVSLLKNYAAMVGDPPLEGFSLPGGLTKQMLAQENLRFDLNFKFDERKAFQAGGSLPTLQPPVETTTYHLKDGGKMNNGGGSVIMSFFSEDLAAWSEAAKTADGASPGKVVGKAKFARELADLRGDLYRMDQMVFKGKFGIPATK